MEENGEFIAEKTKLYLNILILILPKATVCIFVYPICWEIIVYTKSHQKYEVIFKSQTYLLFKIR